MVDPATLSGASNEWDNTPTKTIRLRQLKDYVRRKDQWCAAELLNQKLKVKIDDEYILPTSKAIFQHTFALDFFAAIPREPGFSVILPPDDYEPSISWNFDLTLHSPFRPFHMKHGMLHFNPEHATMWLGRKESLDIWCIYAREEDIVDTMSAKAGKRFTKPTQLSRLHVRFFCSWMLYLLSQTNYPGIYCNEDNIYDINLDGNPTNWHFAIGFKCVHHHAHAFKSKF